MLLERYRAAELATAAHPVLADGPAVMSLLETVTAALVGRGLSPDKLTWDAWRNEDSRWTVQLGWQAGRSDNVAHFRFTPGAHGGMVTAIDDAASELIDPDFKPRRLAPVARLAFEPTDESAQPAQAVPLPNPRSRRPPHRPSRPPRLDAVSRPSRPGRTCCSASAQADSANAASANQAPRTPTPAPRTNQRNTRVRRHPQKVGASPPTATMLRPTASSG